MLQCVLGTRVLCWCCWCCYKNDVLCCAFLCGTVYNGCVGLCCVVLYCCCCWGGAYGLAGEVVAGRRHGTGVSTSKHFSSGYEGSWKDDKRHGFGKYTTSSYVYEGRVVCTMRVIYLLLIFILFPTKLL